MLGAAWHCTPSPESASSPTHILTLGIAAEHSTVPAYIFLPFLAVFLAFVLRREIAEWRRERRRRAAAASILAMQATRAEYEAENPVGPPLTREEIAGFEAWYDSLALPAVELTPARELPVRAGGTRIGGPVWLAEGEAWPVDVDGVPLSFVAQVDFAELPPLPDFPAAGVLQFFVASLDSFEAHLDGAARGSVRVLWRPDALAGGRLHPQPADTDGLGPFERKDVRDSGLSLAGRAAVHRAPASDWRIYERLKGQDRRPGIEEAWAVCEGDEPPLTHHVGGHPVFTQGDFREPDRFGDYDRTLLRLTSDRNLIWGDCGEAVFLIRRHDLLARDFSSVIFYWDCT